MYYVQTQNSRAVQPMDALRCGRVLVVDDDKVFGTFVLAALETKGHDVDWAGSIQDALGSMYASRYDLVIIDLRLPDGSGLQLLRDATDEGLLADSAAIILTGRDDFEQPSDIRVFHKSHDIDTFLDRIGDIVAATRQRRTYSGASRPPGRAAPAGPSHRRERPAPAAEGGPPRTGAVHERGVRKVPAGAPDRAAGPREVQHVAGEFHRPRPVAAAVARRRGFGGVHADARQARARAAHLDCRQSRAGGAGQRSVRRERRGTTA